MRSNVRGWIGLLAVMMVIVGVGCERDDSTVAPATFPVESDVFIDGLAAGVDFQAFAGTAQAQPNGTAVDNVDTYSGTAAFRFVVPDGSDPAANFAGGALVSTIGRDLSSFNAVTFYAKASIPATMGVGGLGNDNTGTSMYTAERQNFDVGTSWAKYVVPIPDPSYLTAERGLFHFAAGAVDGQPWTLWIDEVKYEDLGTVILQEATLASETVNLRVGDTIATGNLSVIFDDLGSPLTVSAMPSYFDFASSDNAVATVDPDGTITAVGLGTADVTAELAGTAANGMITAVVGEALDGPADPPTAPTFAAGEVVALYSDEYTSGAVDTWSADWDDADVEDVTLSGDNAKLYTNLVFAGIDFSSATINASGMTNFYLNAWTPNDVDAGTQLKIKLVDFGADGVFNESGGDDSEAEITLTASSSPAVESGTWMTLDIPLSQFTSLSGTSAMAQIILSGTLTDLYIDNILFHSTGGGGGGGGGDAPSSPAPAPTWAAADVTSLFSNAYTDNPVDTWSAEWDVADVEDIQVSGDDVKKYSNVTFAGIEFTSQTVDASAHTHIHFDLWTPDATDGGESFIFKLVDFGPDDAFDGGDDSEATVTLTAGGTPALATGQWVSADIPLDDFAALNSRANLAQIVFEGGLSTVFLDNIYFYTDDGSGGGGGGDAPSSPAPIPGYAAGNVVSMFSDAYTDVTVDTWSTEWDNADVADDNVSGDAVKVYSNTVFAGVEAASSPIDASGMTHFRMDVWTGDETAGSVFKIKLVDFGPDGQFDGGDDTEHELVFNAGDNPSLQSGAWVTFDLPLSDFTGMTNRTAVAQLIFVSDPGPNTLYIDNVLFHN